MALTPRAELGYGLKNSELSYSNLNWENGVAEVGGADKVASLDFVTSERAGSKARTNLSGRVREGVLVLPDNYLIFHPTARRIIIADGLALLAPKEAADANRAGKWYTPQGETQELAIIRALKGLDSVLIDEEDVKDNVLNIPLDIKRWKSKYTLQLFGGKRRDETKTENARAYVVEQLTRASKPIEVISLYLPDLNESNKVKAPIATQIWSGGLAVDFYLDGYYRDLHVANGVFGVSS